MLSEWFQDRYSVLESSLIETLMENDYIDILSDVSEETFETWQAAHFEPCNRLNENIQDSPSPTNTNCHPLWIPPDTADFAATICITYNKRQPMNKNTDIHITISTP